MSANSRYSGTLQDLRVLVVDDEPDICKGLTMLIKSLGCEADAARSAEIALARIEREPVDIVVSDIKMGGMSGVQLMDEIKKRWHDTSVVLLTGFGTIELAVECIHKGAAHFLTKPFDNEEIIRTVTRLGEDILARRRSNTPLEPADGIIAVDPQMREVLEVVNKVAPSNIPVLIEGESGTGKELVARAIHRRSLYHDGELVPLNCAALPDSLLESELFGYRRGAFTGADRHHTGIFQRADNGTVFLDEVSSMSQVFQGKLLRVLQEHRIRTLGSEAEETVNFRIVSASNRRLEDAVGERSFREDLFYRLNGVILSIPPLRDRPSDIVPLATYFLNTSSRIYIDEDKTAPAFSPAAVSALQRHTWKGNVRELQHTVERAVVLSVGEEIEPAHLMLDLELDGDADLSTSHSYEQAKQEVLNSFQRKFICRVLERTEGNISKAAEECGLTRAAIQKMMRKLNIERSDFC